MGDTRRHWSGLVGGACHPRNVSQTGAESRRPGGSWGRPATEPGAGWAVVDVETTGFRPGQARIVSVAALAVGDDGNVEGSFSSLLDPGVDPGPTHVHGLTTEMLAGQPTFADIVDKLVEVLRGRTLVAHNVAFDYSFLTAEAELVGAELPDRQRHVHGGTVTQTQPRCRRTCGSRRSPRTGVSRRCGLTTRSTMRWCWRRS